MQRTGRLVVRSPQTRSTTQTPDRIGPPRNPLTRVKVSPIPAPTTDRNAPALPNLAACVTRADSPLMPTTSPSSLLRSIPQSLGRLLRTRLGKIVAVLVLAVFGWLVYQAVAWPDVARLRLSNPTTTAFIERYRDRRRAAGESDRVSWQWVPARAISPNLKRAVVAAEDLEFFTHAGFSASEARAALRKAITEWEAPRGASTITQQLAKNLWLSPSRNPLRKLKEAILTRQFERSARQGPDPRDLPERGGVRARDLRGGGCGAALFRQVRGVAHRIRGCTARGQSAPPVQLASRRGEPVVPPLRGRDRATDGAGRVSPAASGRAYARVGPG